MDSSNTIHKTDEELVQMSLAGTWYFALLVDRYEGKLRRYIKRIAPLSLEDLDDLLQNIFIKVYENLNAFDQTLKFSSWIYRIAHNEAISFFRYKKIRIHENLDDITDDEFQTIISDIDIKKEIENEEHKKLLLQSINLVDDKGKEILILNYFEYKSYDEISDILQIPPGTVAVRLKRAKEKLKSIISDKGYIHE